jgi:YVTN family beta-propeller protein
VTNGNDKTVTVIDYKTKKTVTLQVGEKPWAIVPILNSQGQGA